MKNVLLVFPVLFLFYTLPAYSQDTTDVDDSTDVTPRDFFPDTTYQVGVHPHVVTNADIDNDGDVDLVVSNWYSYYITVFRNSGDGTFLPRIDIPTLGQATYVMTTDIDGDSDIDFVVASANYPSGGQGSITIMKNNGYGIFSNPYGYFVSSSASTVCAADVDFDGDMDLAVTNWYSSSLTLFYNNGTGSMERGLDYVCGSYPYEIIAADFTGDRKIDLATANTEYGSGSGSVTVLENTGTGTFESFATFTTGAFPQSLVAADIDNDADKDLIVPNRDGNNVTVLKNDGTGLMEQYASIPVGKMPTAITTADFDHDYDMDFVVTNSYAYYDEYGTVSFLENDGLGNLTEISTINVGSGPRTATRADFNNDGMFDIATTSWNENIIEIYINEERKYRSFTASTSLAATANKVNIVNGNIQNAPNEGAMMKSLYSKIKNTPLLLGIPQISSGHRKQFAWISFSNLKDVGKFFKKVHSGKAYPLDSLRNNGVAKKKLFGVIKSLGDKYNNIAIEQALLLKLNILASDNGITPRGFGNLMLNTNTILFGRQLKDKSLIQISNMLDSMFTYWNVLGLNNPTALTEYDNFFRNVLKPINDGFSTNIALANVSLDVRRYLENRPVPVKLSGVKTASELLIVKSSTRIPIDLNQRQHKTESAPQKFVLSQNFPNPFNPTTTIHYSLSTPSLVTLKVYDVLGREVATLLHNEAMEAGAHEIPFDAAHLSSGVYFYKLTSGDFTETKKMLLMK